LTRFTQEPFSFDDRSKQILIAMQSRGAMIQDILDMEYEDFKDDDE